MIRPSRRLRGKKQVAQSEVAQVARSSSETHCQESGLESNIFGSPREEDNTTSQATLKDPESPSSESPKKPGK